MIRVEKLTKNYGKTQALQGLDLSIGDGELHGFVGPNGAGKTTAMRILATLMKPDSGDAQVDEISIISQPECARRLVGYMPDFFGVYDNLKAWEYLDLYAGCVGMSVKDRRRRIDEMLMLTELESKREAYVDHLSRGMKQRLCLARAMMHDPKLLILDEPASGMDPRARAEMRGILKNISHIGKTVLISSHILPELADMCDHMTILDHGKAIFTGSMSELENRMHSESELTIRFERMPNESLKTEMLDVLKEKNIREEQNMWHIALAQDDERDADILARWIRMGAAICDFHRKKVTLEEVFMEVTEHDA